MEMPEDLNYWTADEIAECNDGVEYNSDLYKKLWKITLESNNPTPLGGDGSDGTVETPDARLNLDNDDKAWWSQLTEDEQKMIVDAHGEIA